MTTPQVTSQNATAQKKLFGSVGLWTAALRVGDSPTPADEIAEITAEVEELGFGTLWLGGSPSVGQAVALLEATSRLHIATGILNIWQHEASDVAAQSAEVYARHGDRFTLGIGVSHGPAVERYARPYSTMVEYLDALDGAPTTAPPQHRVLAALGPKMLRLSRDRALGAHPYLVTAEYVAEARETLGEDALLAPDLKVVLDPDLAAARETARAYLSRYLALPNYTGNLLRLGFTEDDFAGGGSDRLVDGVFGLGDAEAVQTRVDEFLAAGADHVAVQAVADDPLSSIPRAQWRTLAEALPVRASGTA